MTTYPNGSRGPFRAWAALAAVALAPRAAHAQFPDVLSPAEVGDATVEAVKREWPELARATALRAFATTWTSPLTSPDDSAWAIEDFICFTACTPQARTAATALLEDPASAGRPVLTFVPEVMGLQAQHVASLQIATSRRGTAEVELSDAAGREESELGCDAYGFATQVLSPLPLRIEQRPGRITLRYEEHGAERIVFIDERGYPSADSSLALGRSIGRFEGDTLVIETTEIPAGRFHLAFGGGAYSSALRAVERYTLSDDGAWLFLTLKLEDPATLREPLVLIKSWRRTPDVELLPYRCDAVSGQR